MINTVILNCKLPLFYLLICIDTKMKSLLGPEKYDGK
jgi:hypothetical protein